MFRDNAEVHRLQSLKSFYEFHTAIEEECLEKFHSYCDSALSAMHSKTKPDDEGDDNYSDDKWLPPPSHLVYFALLDKWAMWLDSKAPLIKQCSLEKNVKLKESIIKSVEEFKREHPFGDDANSFDVAKKWIDSPQALLTIGIIQMYHKDGYAEADDTFYRVLETGHEFAAEVFYYKACMRMRDFAAMRKNKSSLTLKNKQPFKEDVRMAIEYFYKSRTAFQWRLERKEREAAVVAQMIEKLADNNPKVLGFAAQISSITTYIRLILANIDYLLGSPCHHKMFAQDGVSEEESKKVHDLLVGQCVISPTLLTGRPAEDWQIETLRRKYKLQKKQIQVCLCFFFISNYFL